VRTTFLKENFAKQIEAAEPLSRSYLDAAASVIGSSEISDIKLNAGVSRFLQNPIEGLNRFLYDPLFDLLKGKIDIEDFEQIAFEKVESSIGELLRLGFEHWVMVSLVDLLQPVQIMTVPAYGALEDCTMDGGGEPAPGVIQEEVPKPEPAHILSLARTSDPAFLLPDVIARSQKTGGYVSMLRALFAPERAAKNVSLSREWITYRQVGVHSRVDHDADWPDMVLYTDDKPEELVLVVDFSRFCRPDMIIECMELDGWYQPDEIERIKRNQAFFRPRLGTFIISRFPVPEEVQKAFIPEPATTQPEGPLLEAPAESAIEAAAQGSGELPVTETDAPSETELDIHILAVDFDRSKLEPVISTIAPDSQTGQEKEEAD
jgi:hypothetical protein